MHADAVFCGSARGFRLAAHAHAWPPARFENPTVTARLAVQLHAADVNADGMTAKNEMAALPAFDGFHMYPFDVDANGGLNGDEIAEAARVVGIVIAMNCETFAAPLHTTTQACIDTSVPP